MRDGAIHYKLYLLKLFLWAETTSVKPTLDSSNTSVVEEIDLGLDIDARSFRAILG